MLKANDIARRVAAAVEWRDVLFLAGFALIWVGGSRLNQAWTMVALGCVCVVLSLPRKG